MIIIIINLEDFESLTINLKIDALEFLIIIPVVISVIIITA
jgi:hypothetical protein